MTSDNEWVEPEMHPLWEYPSYPRSDTLKLMTFDLSCPVPSTLMRETGVMEIAHPPAIIDGGQGEGGGRCNGVVLWMDYQLTDQHTTTTGLVKV